jgi:hypothetical protein
VQAKGNTVEVSQALFDRYVSATELKQHFSRRPNTDAPSNDIRKKVRSDRLTCYSVRTLRVC